MPHRGLDLLRNVFYVSFLTLRKGILLNRIILSELKIDCDKSKLIEAIIDPVGCIF